MAGRVRVRIHRRPVSDGFAQIPNNTLTDQRLSYRARGILAEILSRPDDWEISAARIAALGRRYRGSHAEGTWIVLAAFRELEACGYLRRKLVRGPRGRLATELHFYDIPAGGTGYRSTSSRFTEAPVTEAPVTDRPVSNGSLQRPSTKTRTNTGRKDRLLSLGEMLRVHLPDMADDEREQFAEFAVTGCRDRRKLRPYLRSIIDNGDLPVHLAEFQGNGTQRAQGTAAAGPRQGPACPHGEPDGAGINPRSGRPWCPLCRIEAPAGQGADG
jgi:hypothetical protein